MDEIEKAHTDVFNMLLQIMDEGKLTDSFGRAVDFRNTVLIMTSNIGSEVIKNQGALGFREAEEALTYEQMKGKLMEVVDKHFRPEFLNRLDDIIVFRSLTKTDLRRIIDLELEPIGRRLKDKGIELRVSPEAKDYLLDSGYNPDFGARPLRRTLEREVEDVLSESLLRGEFKGKDVLEVRLSGKKLLFEGRVREGVAVS